MKRARVSTTARPSSTVAEARPER